MSTSRSSGSWQGLHSAHLQKDTGIILVETYRHHCQGPNSNKKPKHCTGLPHILCKNSHFILLEQKCYTHSCLLSSLERQIWREKVGESLGERLLHITDTLNRHDYIPSPPNQADIDFIYDTNYPDVQPFLFKVS